VFIRVHLWFGDPSTEFILSVVERTQGMLIGNKHVLKNKANLQRVQMSISLYEKKYYGDFGIWRQQKNKANSKPIMSNIQMPPQKSTSLAEKQRFAQNHLTPVTIIAKFIWINMPISIKRAYVVILKE